MKTFRKIISYVRPYSWRIVLHTLFMLAAIGLVAGSIAFLDTVVKLLFSSETSQIIAKVQSSPFGFLGRFNSLIIETIEKQGKIAALSYAILIIVSMNVAGNILKYLAQYFMNFIRTKVIEDLRRESFQKISRLQLAYFDKERKGDIVTRLTGDLINIENSVVVTLESLIRDPVSVGVFLYLMLKASPELTLIILVLLPLIAILITVIGKSLRKDSYKTQEKLSLMTSVVEEFSEGLRVVKAFNAEDYVNRIFRKYNSSYSHFSRKIQNKQRSIPLISESLGVITMGVFLYVGGSLVFNDKIQESLILTFVFFFQQIMRPARNIFASYGNIMKGIASGDRLFKLIESPVLISDKPGAKELVGFEREISYENVNFGYNHDLVLENIDLSIPKGKVYAVVGKSGGGKTTFIELLLRFYDVYSGSIKIDGVDIRDIKLRNLRNLMAVVTQEPILFNDTVFNNIAFGLDGISEEAVIEAAKAANAHEFIMEMEEGYHTHIGDRGTLLSGGQRQRLSIARAILKNPQILILDEATSSLDTASEKMVQDALDKLMKNRTSIVIAHRLSTIQNADMIIVLDKGKLVEKGTHNELINAGGTYYQLYRLQQLAGSTLKS